MILEERVKIKISNELIDVFQKMSEYSVIAKFLLQESYLKSDLVDDPIDYLSLSVDDKNKISYLTSARLNSVGDDYWHSSKRFAIKPGAFVKKILRCFSERDIESFSTLFRNIQNDVKFNFKIVSGSDILKYYLHDSYSRQSSSLGASCMKHENCQENLEIYSQNDDVIKMVIILDDNDKLIGRALLWDMGTTKVMDRIYTIDDEKYSYVFKSWANENQYIYKKEQKWNNTLYFESNGKTLFNKLSVKLASYDYNIYPYFDTFKFLDDKTGTIYNYIPDDVKVCTLTTTEGRKLDSDFLALDGYTNLYYHYNDTVFVDYMNYRTHYNNVIYSEINNKNILKDHAKYSEELRDHIFIDDDKNDAQRIEKRKKEIEDYIKEQEERKKSKHTIYHNPYADFSSFRLFDESLLELESDIL